MNLNWKKLREAIAWCLLGYTLAGVAVSYGKFGPIESGITAITALCLALGFWITEMLVGVLTGVKKANTTAIALLFLGKLAWWAALFGLSRYYPAGTEVPIAIGMGAFILALVTGVLSQYGWPKISDA
jgi:hypothetical protein